MMLPTLQDYCEINEFIDMVTLYNKFSAIVSMLLLLSDLMAEIKAQRKRGKMFMPMK